MDSQRIAHMGRYHLILHRYRVTASAPMRLEITADIEDDIWELHGPHYSETAYEIQDNTILCSAKVQNGKDRVAVGRSCTWRGQKPLMRKGQRGCASR